MENKFYVYMYSDQDNTPFYVGKGSNDRFHVSGHLYNNQPFLKRKIKKIGVDNIKVHLLHKNLTETMVFQFEAFYIGFYGRRDLGEGTLCNLTNGGEGLSGINEETRRKISKAMKGNQNGKGFTHSKETKRKMSEDRKGKYKGENHPMHGKQHSEDARRKMSEANRGKNNPMYGKKHSEETKKKMSKAKIGKYQGKKNPMYGTHRKGKDNPMYGKKHTKETRQKMSNALKGKNNPMYGVHRKGKDAPMYGKHLSEEARKKISESNRSRRGKNNPMYGKHISEDHKRKMNEGLKLYWAKKKNQSNPEILSCCNSIT